MTTFQRRMQRTPWGFYLLLALIAWVLVMFGLLLGRISAERFPAEEPVIEAWVNTAEKDYMEDPMESEHIEQAIIELPEKRYELTDEEFYLVCGIVSAEAKGEPYEGMMAVAQTILDNCERNECRPFDLTWMYTTPDDTWSDEVWLAVTAVFFEGQTAFDEKVYWFYNPALCDSDFHESQKLVGEIGGHRFFTEKE